MKNSTKTIYLSPLTSHLSPLLAAVLLLTSCHKRCVCTAYNGAEHEYTAEEVEEHGGGCSNMIIQGGERYYSVCVWR